MAIDLSWARDNEQRLQIRAQASKDQGQLEIDELVLSRSKVAVY